MIATHGLVRRFGQTTAVDHVDLELPETGVVVLLGRNGAGKTTLLRILAALLPPTSGRATVAGLDVASQPEAVRRVVGWLPHAPPGWDALRVGEVLGTLAQLRGLPGSAAAGRIGEVLATVGLSGWERRRMGTLSRGTRQRVGIAQALLDRPGILLLDEPMAGLDPLQRAPILEHLADLGRDRLVVWSTHDLAGIASVCDALVVMDEGRVVGSGSVADLAVTAGLAPCVRVEVDAPELAAPALARFGTVRVGTHGVDLPADAPVPAVVAACVAAGVAVRGVRAVEPDPAAIFHALVGR